MYAIEKSETCILFVYRKLMYVTLCNLTGSQLGPIDNNACYKSKYKCYKNVRLHVYSVCSTEYFDTSNHVSTVNRHLVTISQSMRLVNEAP